MGDNIRENLDEGSTLLVLHPDWKEHLREDLLHHFASVSGSDRHEYGSGRVPHFSYQPRGSASRVFVREIFRGGWLGFLGNFHFGHDRLEGEIRAVEKARQVGIPVPAILATKASRIIGPFYRLTVVLEEIAGAKTIFDRSKGMAPKERRKIVEETARQVRAMHDHGIYHVDLTVLNILLDDTGNLHIIDLDKALTPARPDARMGRRVLARLTRSVEKTNLGLTRTERVRFLRAYLGGRNGIRELARTCSKGLWLHRIGWGFTGRTSS